jgi:hypothetical protein
MTEMSCSQVGQVSHQLMMSTVNLLFGTPQLFRFQSCEAVGNAG